MKTQKNTLRKLEIARETLRRLSDRELRRADGAAWSDDSVCPRTTDNRAICVN